MGIKGNHKKRSLTYRYLDIHKLETDSKADSEEVNTTVQERRRSRIIQEIVQNEIEFARRNRLDTSIGAIIGQEQVWIKLRRGLIVDCDYLDCKDWGRYTNCSLPGYRTCASYRRRKVKVSEYRLGITLKLT